MKITSYLIGIVLLLTIVSGYFLVNPTQLLSLINPNNPSVVHAQTLFVYNKIPTQTGKNLFLTQSNNLTKKVDPELVDLDSQIISCDPNVNKLSSGTSNIGGSCVGGDTTLTSTKGMYLGGQCCGAMTDLGEYHDNLKKLQSYKNIPDIPLNPHKTPIPLAQKWISYDKATTLTQDQQKVYDEAMKMSKEGPCCCKCWHYYVDEGIAKKLIANNHYNSKQIDDFWAASDIC